MHVFFYGRWAMFQGRMWESIPLPGVNVEIFVVVMLLAFHLWTPKKSCVCHATWHPKLACTPHSKKKTTAPNECLRHGTGQWTAQTSVAGGGRALCPHYDLAFWSQTSWKWVEAKLTEMGILFATDYRPGPSLLSVRQVFGYGIFLFLWGPTQGRNLFHIFLRFFGQFFFILFQQFFDAFFFCCSPIFLHFFTLFCKNAKKNAIFPFLKNFEFFAVGIFLIIYI